MMRKARKPRFYWMSLYVLVPVLDADKHYWAGEVREEVSDPYAGSVTEVEVKVLAGDCRVLHSSRIMDRGPVLANAKKHRGDL